jgi:hypothetical protein
MNVIVADLRTDHIEHAEDALTTLDDRTGEKGQGRD